MNSFVHNGDMIPRTIKREDYLFGPTQYASLDIYYPNNSGYLFELPEFKQLMAECQNLVRHQIIMAPLGPVMGINGPQDFSYVLGFGSREDLTAARLFLDDNQIFAFTSE